jgi:hypothetical protein
MPRGCITIMEAGGYAVEGQKHCVRPVDLSGAVRSFRMSEPREGL